MSFPQGPKSVNSSAFLSLDGTLALHRMIRREGTGRAPSHGEFAPFVSVPGVCLDLVDCVACQYGVLVVYARCYLADIRVDAFFVLVWCHHVRVDGAQSIGCAAGGGVGGQTR